MFVDIESALSDMLLGVLGVMLSGKVKRVKGRFILKIQLMILDMSGIAIGLIRAFRGNEGFRWISPVSDKMKRKILLTISSRLGC